MKIQINEGVVAADSILPKFTDLSPERVEPQKILIADSFTQVRTALTGTRPDIINAGQTWLGSSFVGVQDAEGGYAHRASAPFEHINLGQSDGKVFTAIKWGAAASYAGILFRYENANNYWRLSLSHSAGVLLERRVGAVTTPMVSTAFAKTVGQTYLLGVSFVGNQIAAIVEGSPLTVITDSALADRSGVGLSSGDAAHHFYQFVAGQA